MKKSLLIMLLLLLAVSIQVEAQQRVITGPVTSGTDKEPIPGANVQIKGTTVGSITDLD
ncbi:MAG: carboxypeptidase-like regulatory domain-containing protein [Cyclobacteriaceae bacterium]|nr:carboxypeptidase-like regulatory domain-containing protein [Cyclobacteriaceae bacterium]